MTIDEAIRHAEEVAERNEKQAREQPNILGYEEKYFDCGKCAEEHRQLADWLKELKALKAQQKAQQTSEGTTSDTISRQDAIRVANGYCHPANIAKELERLPSAEPIIRCKDCKWFRKAGCAIEIVDDSDKPTEDDYCSFAERRTDEGD